MGIGAMALVACGGSPTVDDTGGRAVTFLTAPFTDTVMSQTRELAVKVRAPAGTPIVLRSTSPMQLQPFTSFTAAFARTREGLVRSVDTVLTDAGGTARTFLRIGPIAGDETLTASVPSLGDSAQLRVTIRPGTAIRLVATPRDSAVYVAGRYSLRPELFDGYNNKVTAPAFAVIVDDPTVASVSSASVEGRAIGRARFVVQAGPFSDTVWTSVVPQGRIAAVRYRVGGDTTNLVLVNLDGSSYRSFPMQSQDAPRPAWHPDGSHVIASIMPGPMYGPELRRLSALDTLTGAWRPLRGTSDGWGDGYAEYSRDGRWIYIASSPSNYLNSQSSSAVYRLRTDGTGPVEPVGYTRSSNVTVDFPSISPDGQRVALQIENGGHPWTLMVDPAIPLGPVQGFLSPAGHPVGGRARWSPTGQDLLLAGDAGMWLINAADSGGTNRRMLALGWHAPQVGLGGFRGASWSPDGRWIVARTGRGMVVVEVSSGRALPLAFLDPLQDPAWRP